MKSFLSDYQGLVLKILSDKSPQNVDEIIDIAIANKFTVKKDDLEPNDDTRNGEEKIRQRVRNHLRSARPLLLKNFVKYSNGKYKITAKGKKHFLSSYSGYVGSKLKTSLVAQKSSLLTNNHDKMISDLLVQWYSAKVRQIVLEGPPGTGKTRLARKIVDDGILIQGDFPMDYHQQLNRYCSFVQFHPSYSYEDFVEGLRPTQNRNNDLVFVIKRGPFFNMCAYAMNSGICGVTEEARIAFDTYEVSHFTHLDSSQVEIVGLQNGKIIERHPGVELSFGAKDTFANIEKINSNLQYIMRLNDPLNSVDNSDPSSPKILDEDKEYYENFESKEKDIWLLDSNLNVVGTGILEIKSGSIKKPFLFGKANNDEDWCFIQPKELHYFLIDEINRANASEVFGELLVQLEYRIGNESGLSAKLPYSGQELLVPDNVFLVATMNNMDRSLLKLDRALLRRFNIINIAPDPTVFRDVSVENISIEKLFVKLNNHLQVNFGNDLSYRVGHAYFTKLLKFPEISELQRIWYFELFPLIFDLCEHDADQIVSIGLFPGLDLDASNTSAFNRTSPMAFKKFLNGFIEIVDAKSDGSAA